MKRITKQTGFDFLCATVAFLVLVAGKGPSLGAEATKTADEIVKASGIRAGLCVHLGVTDGKLTAELAQGRKFVVHGLASDAADVEKTRKHIQSKGIYGDVAVECSDLRMLPYAENLVNLVVAEDLPRLLKKGLSLKEVTRVLVPNGAICFGGKVDPKKLTAAGLDSAKTSGPWTRAIKPRPKEMGDWPMFDYSVEGNPVTKDRLVGATTSLRWRTPMYSRHSTGVVTAWVSAGGRMFYCRRKLLPHGYKARYILTAVDAYNGELLWEKPVKRAIGSNYGDRNVVATSKLLYVCLESKGPLVALDAATGELVKKYDKAGKPTSLLLHEGKLIMSTWNASWAVDTESGEALWQNKKKGGLMVASGGRLYLFAYPREIHCVDPTTGKQEWMAPFGPEQINKYNNPFSYGGALVLVQGSKKVKYGLCVRGFSRKDGKRLWSFDPRSILRRGGCYMGEVFGAQGLIWVHAMVEPNPEKNNTGKRPSAWIGLDPMTGEIKKRYDDATGDPAVSKMLANGTHRCNRGRATENGYLFGTNEFFEWKTGKYHASTVTRSHCGTRTGMMPANGLTYAPPATCMCLNFIERGGFHALAYRPDGLKANDTGRLTKGPAYGKIGSQKSEIRNPVDWPCYRYNAARLGGTESEASADPKVLWSIPLGRRLTAPVVAGQTAFVALEDEHQVVALNTSQGKVLWRFTAEGRIDSPPTITAGQVLFGSRDGHVYALRAADGKMLWRFRAAPIEERIMVNSQLESAWPVHGSVVVVGDVAYFAAGWHTDLDGGVTIWALKSVTGEVLWKRPLEKLPGNPRYANGPVALLTSDGKFLFMGRRVFNLKTGETIAKVRGQGRVVSFGRSGFRDHNWAQFSNYKGHQRWGDGRASGELLTSNEDVTCGVTVGLRGGNDGVVMGVGSYKLFGRGTGTEKAWSMSVPLAPRAMVVAGKTLFVAGQPDPEIVELTKVKNARERFKMGAALPDEKFATKGGEFWVVSVANGEKQKSIPLTAPPVFDGMAVAGGRIYVSTLDGKLWCLGK